MAKITTLVYTVIDRFILLSIPPSIGAIKLPLLQVRRSGPSGYYGG